MITDLVLAVLTSPRVSDSMAKEVGTRYLVTRCGRMRKTSGAMSAKRFSITCFVRGPPCDAQCAKF